MFPELDGVEDQNVLRSIVKLINKDLPITTTAKNIDFEFYWKDKCKDTIKNCRKEDHGNSYKQAFIEKRI